MKPIVRIEVTAEAVEFFFQQTLDAFNRLPLAELAKLRRGMTEIMRFAESTLSEYERNRLQQEGVNAVRRSAHPWQATGYWAMDRLKQEVAKIADHLELNWRFSTEGEDLLVLQFRCEKCSLNIAVEHSLETWRLNCPGVNSIEAEVVGFLFRELVMAGIFHKNKSPNCRGEMLSQRLKATSCETHPEAIIDYMNSQPEPQPESWRDKPPLL